MDCTQGAKLMSAKYTFLAWDTPIVNAPLKLALLQLANNADDDGFSYYSISKMAVSCGMSDRTFMRKIAELEKMNVLTVERRSNRPSLYSLIGDEMGVSLCHLQDAGVTESHAGVTDCHEGVTESHLVGDRLSHDLNSTPNNTPNTTLKSISPKEMLFDKFWKAYDKNNDQPKCRKKFVKLNNETIEKIMSVVEDYVKSTPDKTFRKKPWNWLQAESWNDEIQLPLTAKDINQVGTNFSKKPDGW
jgi:DNA-binding transcriptional ArsR family regulator